MSQVFGIDPKHVKGERRLGLAIRQILLDKVVRANGDFIVKPRDMARLQRAFDLTFPEPSPKEIEFLKQMRRVQARRK